MSFVAISTWTFPDGSQNERLMAYATESLKELREQGAERAYMVKTSETDVIFFTVYPDEAAYQRAANTLAERRAGGSAATGGSMTGTLFGEAIIEL